MQACKRTVLLPLAAGVLGAFGFSPLRAAEPQGAGTARTVEDARLPGSTWDVDAALGDRRACFSRSVEFSRDTNAQGAPALRAVEMRQCSRTTYRLNYFAYPITSGSGRFVSLLPANVVDPAVPSSEVLNRQSGLPAGPGTSAGNSYSPDRLTLELSGDGCTLSGAGRDGNYNFRWLTLRRHDCSFRNPR